MDKLEISVVIPTFQRVDALRKTLRTLSSCDPAPAEVIVHTDAGDRATETMLVRAFPGVRHFAAKAQQGPGGLRNSLIREAQHDIVVSFDDDSYPIDPDFFTRVLASFNSHPEAGILAMTIIHDGESLPRLCPRSVQVADFVGCGCAYRRSAFLETYGYLPLQPAYGMEEADIALQLIERGWQIVARGDLRVRHATDRSHQAGTAIVAAHIRNTALLAFLRYPCRMTGLGFAQVANRVLYSALRGHVWGVISGIIGIPGTLFRHRAARLPVTVGTVRAVRRLRRQPVVLKDVDSY